MDASSPLFTFALEQMEGVGRVTAGRILSQFPTYPDLLRYPQEQVYLRIKGVPRAEQLAKQLRDEGAMTARMDAARNTLESYTKRQIQVLARNHLHWPIGFEALKPAECPLLLYAYGHTVLLTQPSVALLAQPPLTPPTFELAQDLVRHLMTHDITPVAGAVHGFDVVVHRICATSPTPHPSMMVASTGLARVKPDLRPHISTGVKAGGLFVSSFQVQHGPFAHDDRERALLETALASAVVFFEPEPHTPEWHALEWALEHHRPVFGVAAEAHPLPERVHPVREAVDFDWILTAAKLP